MGIVLEKTTDSIGRALSVAKKWLNTPNGIIDVDGLDCVLLFTEGYVNSRQWRENTIRFSGRRCLLYSEADYPNLAIRGLYPSVYKRKKGRVPFHYLVKSLEFPEENKLISPVYRKQKAGFMGLCSTHRVRQKLKLIYPEWELDTSVGNGIRSVEKGDFHCDY